MSDDLKHIARINRLSAVKAARSYAFAGLMLYVVKKTFFTRRMPTPGHCLLNYWLFGTDGTLVLSFVANLLQHMCSVCVCVLVLGRSVEPINHILKIHIIS